MRKKCVLSLLLFASFFATVSSVNVEAYSSIKEFYADRQYYYNWNSGPKKPGTNSAYLAISEVYNKDWAYVTGKYRVFMNYAWDGPTCRGEASIPPGYKVYCTATPKPNSAMDTEAYILKGTISGGYKSIASQLN